MSEQLSNKGREQLLAAILERQRRIDVEKNLWRRRNLKIELEQYLNSAKYYGVEVPERR